MTLDEVRRATAEAADAAEMLMAHLDRLGFRIAGDFPVSAEIIAKWDDSRREQHHAMLRMFEQVYDLASKKLLRGFLILSGEDVSSLSARNVFNRAEKLGALSDANRWLEIGATRNILIHEYPTDPALQARNANLAWEDLSALRASIKLIVDRLHSEKLL